MTEIRPYLQKQSWFRRAPRQYSIRPIQVNHLGTHEMKFDEGLMYPLTQADFMDELSPSSHKINNCFYRSDRIKYRYDEATQKNVPDGLEEVERVEIAFQEGALRHKVTTTFGNPIWFGANGKDDKDDKIVSSIKSHWEISGMTDALSSWGRALFGTGDAAIYLYKEDGIVKYKTFSFERGDVFNFTKNEKNEDIFVRMFKVAGQETIEVYDNKNVSVWIRKNERNEYQTWYNKALSILRGKSIEESTDGYVLIDRKAHGLSQLPVMYWRISDVVWGVGQAGIERLERILSDLGENNRYYAYQILFLAGGVISLPPVGRQGKTIASKTTDGKAEILKPADASNTFTIDLEKNLDLLCETLSLVIINPKELKAGENTGAFIRNLYWREVQWSTNMIAELRPAFTKLISIFKEIVGQIEDKPEAYKKVRMSFLLEPYVPKNITEEITNVCMAKNSGITSIDTASGEIPFNNPREVEKLKKETMEKQAREDALAILKKKSAEAKSSVIGASDPPVSSEKGEGANNQSK